MLDVHGGDHVDARLQELVDVLPPLLVDAIPGTLVCASSSISATSGARAMIASTSISSNVDPRYSTARPRHDLQVADRSCGQGPSVRLHEPDHDVGAALTAPMALAQHREGLADAGRVADVDAELAALHACEASRSSARLSSRTFTRGSPRNPNVRPFGVLVDQREDLWSSATPRASATRGACSLRVRGTDVGVETAPARGDGIDRESGPVERLGLARSRPIRSFTASPSSGLEGPRFDGAARGGIVGVRSAVEPLRALERLTDQGRSDDRAIDLHEAPVRHGAGTRLCAIPVTTSG